MSDMIPVGPAPSLWTPQDPDAWIPADVTGPDPE